jgi:pheromone shutdown protein TraB
MNRLVYEGFRGGAGRFGNVIHFRDFIQATTIRSIMRRPDCPANILVVQGIGHSGGVQKLVENDAYYERYRRHVMALTKHSRRLYERKKRELERIETIRRKIRKRKAR